MPLPVVPYCPHRGGPQRGCHYCALEAAGRRQLSGGDGFMTGYRQHPSRAYVGRLGLGGMGERLPDVTTLPWQIDQPGDGWERASTVLGVIGGVLAILATLRLVR